MNLKILSNEAMITVSGFLTEDPVARALLVAKELGTAALNQMRAAHDLLASMQKRREENEQAIDALGQELTMLDAVHDNKARSFQRHLEGFISGADDQSIVEFCRMLLRMCFPDGLDVITASYLEEAGWARVVDVKVTTAMRTQLDTMQVGQATMGEIFRAWIGAGITLGIRLSERARLRAAVAKSGIDSDELNIISVRSWWIRSARNLLNAVDLMRMGERDRETLIAPIRAAVAECERQRSGQPDTEEPGAEPEPEEPGSSDDGPVTEPTEAGATQDTANAEASPDVEPDIEPDAEPDAELGAEAGAEPTEVEALDSSQEESNVSA